jgi:hypothetical protein
MRDWLVQKWGRPSLVGDLYLSNIESLVLPTKSSGPEANIDYLKSLYSILITATTLEATRGRPVSGLTNYITQNRWLKAVYVALPSDLKQRFLYRLDDEDTDLEEIEGYQYLQLMINMIKSAYKHLEVNLKLQGKQSVPPSQSQVSGGTSAKHQQKVTAHAVLPPQLNVPPPPLSQQTSQASAPPPAVQQPRSNGNSSRSSQGNQLRNNQQSNNNHQQGNPQQNPPQVSPQAAQILSRFAPPINPAPYQPRAIPRWECPLKNHAGHEVGQCVDFWTKASCSDRRADMKQGSCFTCLGYRQGCSAQGCVNAGTTPQDLLCQDCIKNPRLSRDPPNVLLCGLGHFKPTIQELIPRLERWINGFSACNLGAPISVNFLREPTRLEEMDNELSIELFPDREHQMTPLCDHVAPNRKVEIIYDTSTGGARPVDRKKDVIINTSTESAGYVMQLLYFGDQKVLTLYDSGANQNVVQAKLAKDAGFLQLSSKPVAIGVAGGGKIVSEYGQYTAVLGPCQDGCSYSLDCQAVDHVTPHFPLVKLDPAAEEARDKFPADTLFPREIGGDEVKLLVGIRQTQLAPRQVMTLPSGICVFESKVTDVFGSNICFGGPHAIFTEAYRTLGTNFQTSSIQSLQALFTEVATAYIEGPWAFIRDEGKVPCDAKGLLECRDPEPPEFTSEMLKIAVEVAPELVLYKPEKGEPSTLEEKLNAVVTDVAVADAAVGMKNHSIHSTNFEMNPSLETETDLSEPPVKVDLADPAAVRTNPRLEGSMTTETITENSSVQSESHLKVGMAGSERVRTDVDLERKTDAETGSVESDLGLGRFNNSPHYKDCSPTHLLITTPPVSKAVVGISPKSPPTHPTPKEVAGHNLLDCLLETSSPSVVLTKKQRAMLNYRAQLLGATSTLPTPTPTPLNTPAVSVAPPTQHEISPGRKDACTLMSLNAVLCETPPLSAARSNKDFPAPTPEPTAKTPNQLTKDEEYDTMILTTLTEPAPMLPTNSMLSPTLTMPACPVVVAGLSHGADLVMPTGQLMPTILVQPPSTGSKTQPHRPPNLKDPSPPWTVGGCTNLVSTLLYEKPVPLLPAPPLLPGVAPPTCSSFVNRTVDEVLSEHGSHRLVEAQPCLDTGPH